MKTSIFFLSWYIGVFCGSHALAQQAPYQIDIRRTSKPITIDGKLDESAWEKAQWLTLDGRWPPKPQTKQQQAQWRTLLASRPPLALMDQQHKAAMLWDEAGLYCAMRVQDTDVQGQQKKENEWLWLEDVCEFFFAASNKPDVLHYEYQVNPAGTLFLLTLWPGHTADIPSPPSPQTAASVNGTINHSADQDQGYSVEFFLSWDQLQFMGLKRPAESEQSSLLGYARLASWDLTIHALVRMQRFSLPGEFNSHDTTQYRPMFLDPK
jgi:hypothetical protein